MIVLACFLGAIGLLALIVSSPFGRALVGIRESERRMEVLGYDVDERKIAKLSAGEVPIHEPGLDDMLRRNVASGRLRFTTEIRDVAAFGDVHFICVGTPQRADGMGADLTYVETSVTSLAQLLTRKALIVGKSTVPVGTAEWVEQLVSKHAPAELGIEVSWSPEFLHEGFAVEDVLRPNRLVLGVKSAWAHSMLFAAHKGVFDLALNEDRDVPGTIEHLMSQPSRHACEWHPDWRRPCP